MDQDKIAMVGFFIFNLVSVFLAKKVLDSTTTCNNETVNNAAGLLLSICSICLGASAVCVFVDCVGRRYTMVFIGILSVLSIVCASIVHDKCVDARHHTTPLIVLNVLLLVAAIGLGIKTAHTAGLINVKNPFDKPATTGAAISMDNRFHF